MKTNKRRGFTLVELLVVIAILAILATVSVVGYTSFIQRATVSNDENVAAQLNQFLEAYKVDHKGNYYGQEITEDNIWYITQEILEDSQYGELVPQSLEYDYHFYFDLTAGKYVVMKDSDVGVSLARRFYDLIANATDSYESRPGNVFTSGKQYFLVDTSGSPLADAVRLFYTPVLDEDGSAKEIANVVTEAINSEKVHPNLKTLLKNTYFVVNGDTYSYNETGLENVFIHEGVPSVSITGVSFAEGVKPTIVVPNGATVTRLDIPEESTVIFNGTDWEALREIVDAGFVDSDVKVFVSGNEYKVDDVNVTDKNDAHVTTLKYNNPVQSFEITVNGTTYSDGSVISVVYETVNKGLNLNPSNEKGSQYETNPELALSNPNYNWMVTGIRLVGEDTEITDQNQIKNYLSIDSTGLVIFKNEKKYEVESVSVKATAIVPKNGDTVSPDGYAESTYTLGISGLTGATLQLGSHTINADGTTKLIHSANAGKNTSTFAIVGTPVENDKLDGMSFNTDITLTFDSNLITKNGASITTADLGKDDHDNKILTDGTVTVNVQIGCYVSYDVTIDISDFSHMPVQIKNNLVYVGSGVNEIPISALFKLADGETLPDGAQLVVYQNASNDADSYMDLTSRYELVDSSKDSWASYTSAKISEGYSNTIDLTTDGDKNIVAKNDSETGKGLSLTGLADHTALITFAVIHNGVRISDDIHVQVVNAANATTYADITTAIGTNSVVMLNKIEMTDNGTFSIPSGKTFYGNLFELNVENGVNKGEGIINLKGTLKDTKVVGAVYKNIAISTTLEDGSSAVYASGTAVIDNCYLANTRSPLRVNGNTTVRNSVLFGGRYSNIDITGGTLTIEGTVTTVQQPMEINDTTVMGVGISAWFNESKKFVKVAEGADLIQYNFMDSSYVENLGAIGITVLGQSLQLIDLKEPFNAIFEDKKDDGTQKYAEYIFKYNGKDYVNSGIVSTDKYMLDYEITGLKEATGGFLGQGAKHEYKAGDKITVKSTAASGDTVFTISYNSSIFKCITVPDTDGAVDVTATQLNAGVVFEFITNKTYTNIIATSGDPTSYQFWIQNDNFLTLNVDSTIQSKYDNTIVIYNDDLGEKFGSIESVQSMHEKGVHYGKINIDVWTPKNDSNTRLEEYLTIVIGEGKYLPNNFKLEYAD